MCLSMALSLVLVRHGRVTSWTGAAGGMCSRRWLPCCGIVVTACFQLFESRCETVAETVAGSYAQEAKARHSEDRTHLHIGQAAMGPRVELIRFCEELGVDTLVLGSRGLGPMKRCVALHQSRCRRVAYRAWRRFMVGSTVDYCIHHAPCDVFVVKSRHHD